MAALAYSVYVVDPDNQPVWFGPDSDVSKIPAWALDQMGDHVFTDGERPKAAAKKAAASKPAEK